MKGDPEDVRWATFPNGVKMTVEQLEGVLMVPALMEYATTKYGLDNAIRIVSKVDSVGGDGVEMLSLWLRVKDRAEIMLESAQ